VTCARARPLDERLAGVRSEARHKLARLSAEFLAIGIARWLRRCTRSMSLIGRVHSAQWQADAGIDVLEAAVSLYRGDLLDGPDVPTYRWLYDEDPQVALMLRSELQASAQRRPSAARGVAGKLPRGGPGAS
jgi:hypothetical protein